jgi:PAS domain-containing protein
MTSAHFIPPLTGATGDISVAVEKQLADWERQYRGLLEAAPDAMVVVDQSGDIVLLNRQAERQFGYTAMNCSASKLKP